MTDRHEQARAEAERRYPVYPEFDQDDRDHTNAMRYIFLGGVEWADANPQPHTITQGEYAAAKLRHDNWRLTNDPDLAFLAGLHNLGIEVADDAD